MKSILAILALVAPLAVQAEVGGFVNAGPSFTSLETENNSGDRVEYEDGSGFNLTGGLRFGPGLMVKGSYTLSEHDGGDYFYNGRRINSFNDELQVDEFRLGFYYAPPQRGVVGFQVGAGYEQISYDFSTADDEFSISGAFVEAAVLLNAGSVATFDIGGALLGMEDDDNNEVAGAEFRTGVTFHLGQVELGAAYRVLAMITEYDDGDEDDDVFGEFRITIGGKWGYPGK